MTTSISSRRNQHQKVTQVTRTFMASEKQNYIQVLQYNLQNINSIINIILIGKHMTQYQVTLRTYLPMRVMIPIIRTMLPHLGKTY
jgi:hypothetical protein